jgi:hypothetical protein
MNGKKLIALQLNISNLTYARIPCEYIGVFQPNELTLSIDHSYKEYISSWFDGEYIDGVLAMDYLRAWNMFISDIDCIYEDGDEEKIHIEKFDYVLYVNENGNTVCDPQYQNVNRYQRSKINKHGDLFIEISAMAELDSIFPDDVINADDYTVGGKK